MKGELFDELTESVRQGGAILRGEAKPSRSFEVTAPNETLIAWQQRLGLTNAQAAQLLNDTPLRTYEDWKSGRNQPPRLLSLALIEAERRHVTEKGEKPSC